MVNSITVYKGDDQDLSMTFTNNGEVLDITGYVIFLTVKENINDLDTNALIQKTVTTHSDPLNGVSIISIEDTDTSSITPGTYPYDIQLKDTYGKILTVVKDSFIILPDVTRRIE